MANLMRLQTDQSTYVGSSLEAHQELTLTGGQPRHFGGAVLRHHAMQPAEETWWWEHHIPTQIC